MGGKINTKQNSKTNQDQHVDMLRKVNKLYKQGKISKEEALGSFVYHTSVNPNPADSVAMVRGYRDTTPVGVKFPFGYRPSYHGGVETLGFIQGKIDRGELPKDAFIKKYEKGREFGLGGLDIITSGIGTSVSMLEAAAANRKLKIAEQVAQNDANAQQLQIDKSMLEDYNTSGSVNAYFSKGGSFKLNNRTTGNVANFKKLAPNIFKANGPSHERGGIPIGDSTIEGGEVIKLEPGAIKVLSDNDKYYGYSPADNAENNPSNFDAEYAVQEVMKGKKTGNKLDLGGLALDLIPKVNKWKEYNDMKSSMDESLTFIPKSFRDNQNKERPTVNSNVFRKNDAITTELPDVPTNPYEQSKAPYFIDNLGNLVTTAMTPKVPKPVLTPIPNLNTDLDYNPLRKEIRSAERNFVNNTNKNVSDANVAASLGLSASNNYRDAINKVTADEINAENQLKNQEIQLQTSVAADNASKWNNFLNDNIDRTSGILSSLNKNFDNLSRDLIDIKDKANLRTQDKERMTNLLARDTEGSLSEIIKSGAYDYMLLDPSFDPTILSGTNLTEYTKRKALYKMNRNGSVQ